MSTYTEEEAKTKWCPHAVASHMDPRRGFRDDDDPADAASHPCIGSRCMSWRAAPSGRNAKLIAAKMAMMDDLKINAIKCLREFDPTLSLKASKDIVESGNWPAPHSSQGYCGLAGKPE